MYVVYLDCPGGGFNSAVMCKEPIDVLEALQPALGDTECYGDIAYFEVPAPEQVERMQVGTTLALPYLINEEVATWCYVLRASD